MTNENRTPSSPNNMDKKDVKRNPDQAQNRNPDSKTGRDRDSETEQRGNAGERKGGTEDRSSQNW